MKHRFFIPSRWIQANRVTITGPQARQIARVLRMRPGDEIIVLDNSGWEIETRLTAVERDRVQGEVLHRRLSAAEPRTKISLYQSVLKGNRFEWVLQKGTELGVVEFVPLITERCILSDLDAAAKKRPRWERIIQEAAEQCRRGRKPALHAPLLFPQSCERARRAGGLALIPWEAEEAVALREILAGAPLFTVHLFIGPEGGFAPGEVDLAQRYGLQPVTLGPRILRAETAGIAAVAAILFALGDLG